MATSPKPVRSSDAGGESRDRKDRLAAALRENLKKRKQQARARSRPTTDPIDGTAKS